MKLKQFKKMFCAFLGDNDRTILTAFAMTGVAVTVGLAVRATKRLIEKKPEIEAAETNKEKAKIIVKEVAAPVAVGVATELVILKGHKVASDKIATLSQALTITTGAYNTYQQIVEEKTEPGLLSEIRQAFAEKTHEQTVEKIKEEVEEEEKEDPKTVQRVIIDTGTGDEYFELDGILFRAGRYFVKDAFCDADYQVREDYFITVEELHNRLRIFSNNEEDSAIFKNLQWDFPNRGDRIKPIFTEIVDPTIGATVNVISYECPPKPKYRR